MPTIDLPLDQNASKSTKTARIGHVGANGGWTLFGSPQSTFLDTVRSSLSWFTSTSDGSLSETFRLGTDSETGVSDAAGMVVVAQETETETYLDAIVVDNDLPSVAREKYLASEEGGSSGYGNGSSVTPGKFNGRVKGSGQGKGHYHQHNDYQGGAVNYLRWRAWPAVVEFFEPRMPTKKLEEDYMNQLWHSNKSLSFAASLYLVLNWVLYLALTQENTANSLYAMIVFYGPYTFFTLPLPFLVGANFFRTRPVFFQTWFAIATWYCAFAELIHLKECGFSHGENLCHGKTFLSMNYFATGLPALMMFICSNRLYNAIAQVAFSSLICGLLIPESHAYIRVGVAIVIFYAFLQYISYYSDKSKRQMFLLALQLKRAYKSKHKAQAAESKAGFTKRRFANYIFHEVRVPLNNAFLAFQLLQAEQAFRADFFDSAEIHALNRGLGMMTTVLNDVLDFEKMDSGHFENNPKPFPLHRTIALMLDLVGVQASSKDLQLLRSLDPDIDKLRREYPKDSDGDGDGLWVVGNELRLQQILTNLATNAIKYSEGAVTITTKLLRVTMEAEPPPDPPPISTVPSRVKTAAEDAWISEGGMESDSERMVETQERRSMESDRSFTSGSKRSKTRNPPKAREMMTFRLEIKDNGPGIKPSDLVEHRLFQPFVQTSVGKSSGSGTGLGLAIVKQIVKMSGGRLGVISKRGDGATFWVELTYPIATAAQMVHSSQINDLTPTATIRADESLLTPAVLATLRNSIIPAPRPGLGSPTKSNVADIPLRCLVCDDDVTTRMLCRRILEKLGCLVDVASDGKECIEKVLATEADSAQPYDLICLDNFMPVMTGEEAIREMRVMNREEYVVGCTGNALTEDQLAYREAGVDDVLTKPILISDFRRILKVAAERRGDRWMELSSGN